MAKLDSCHRGRVKIEQLHLLPRLNVPHHDLLFRGFASSHQVATVWGESCLQDGSRAKLIELAHEFMFQFPLESVNEHNDILSGT